MADRTLRGAGLGSKSHANPTGIELAPRQEIGFICPRNHEFSVVFAIEAELPTTWECPRCGEVSRRADGVEPEVKEAKPVRTHWDMLRERRSIEELEDLLAERLDEIRGEDA